MGKIFIVLVAIALTACTKSLDIQLEPELTVFFSDDRDKRAKLTRGDKAYSVLNTWLEEHGSDWYATSGNYPGGIYIQSGDHGFQITKTHVILYAIKNTKPMAMYIQKIGEGELAEFRNRDAWGYREK